MNDTLNNRCPSCNGTVVFNPTSQMWECGFCSEKFTLGQMQQRNNDISNQSYNEVQGVVPDSSIKNFSLYRCNSCNSEILGANDYNYCACVFCDSNDVIKEKLLDDNAPNYILPFNTTKEDAVDKFSKLLKWKILAPRRFKVIKNIDKIIGIYVPFWFYDLEANGEVEFEASDVKLWKDSHYKYAKTSRFSVRKSGHFDFNKVLVDASLNLPSSLMDSLPYNLGELVPYNNSYLSGYFIEKPAIDSKSGIGSIAEKIKNIAIDMIQKDVNHQNVAIVREGVMVSARYTNYILLPVWMVNVNYKGKKYTFVMNGQTGEVVGSVPFGILESVICFVILFVIIFGILYLISMFR